MKSISSDVHLLHALLGCKQPSCANARNYFLDCLDLEIKEFPNMQINVGEGGGEACPWKKFSQINLTLSTKCTW